jgi:hypothetical protein
MMRVLHDPTSAHPRTADTLGGLHGSSMTLLKGRALVTGNNKVHESHSHALITATTL